MTRKSDKTRMTSRRRFLKTSAIAGATLAIPGAVSAQDENVSDERKKGEEAAGQALPPAAFKVQGTQTIRTELTPSEIVRYVQKHSPSLKTRYGLEDPVLKYSETIARKQPEADNLPKSKTYTQTLPWDTYYAKEKEWRALYNGDAKAAAETDTSFTIASSHAPAEEANPYGIWEYNNVNGGYEIEAPMNIISPDTIPEVAQTLDSNGWTLAVIQHTRYAWNSATNQFESQHKSAATSTDGTLGRKHLRMWEFEGYVSGSAHVDSAFPHSATSFDDAEEAIETVFDNTSEWNAFDDFYNLNNGGLLDHDGYATQLFKY